MELTRDGFLGGRVQAWQPRHGYRAATDPVFLAAATPARPGDTVLELGCGVGVAALCLAARVPGVALTGVEIQPDYAELARRNGVENSVAFGVHEADLANLPPPLRALSFDHVIANPPYYVEGTAPDDPGRTRARHEATPLEDWIDTAARRLRPKGWLTLILPIDRLPEALALLRPSFGSIAVKPLSARAGRDPARFLLKGQKGSKGPFRLLESLILHQGARHLTDGDDYSTAAKGILRDAQQLDWA